MHQLKSTCTFIVILFLLTSCGNKTVEIQESNIESYNLVIYQEGTITYDEPYNPKDELPLDAYSNWKQSITILGKLSMTTYAPSVYLANDYMSLNYKIDSVVTNIQTGDANNGSWRQYIREATPFDKWFREHLLKVSGVSEVSTHAFSER